MEYTDKYDYSSEENSTLGSCQIKNIDNFEDYYLREVDVELAHNAYLKPEIDALRDHKGTESEMHTCVAKLFTKAALLLCDDKSDDAKCLAAFLCSNKMMGGEFEGSNIIPDLVMQWTTREKANEIVSSADGKLKDFPLYWYNAESFIECKTSIGTEVPSIQATGYVHNLPRILPNLAGMLYAAMGPSNIFLFWSDPSGVLRSHHYPLHEHRNPSDTRTIESIVLRYVATVMNPLHNLPTRDPTMKMKIAAGKPVWDITHAGQSYNDCRQIFGFMAHSRQTCVLVDGKEERVVKDYWRNSERGYSEGDMLKRIKGVPGVVQVDVTGDVNFDENSVLKTSGIHSGTNSEVKVQLEESFRPCRIKHRSVLLSIGEPLEKRESVQEFFEAVYDSLEGHQVCFNERKTLHRDVSRQNILIRPRHHSSVKFDQSFPARFICQILNEGTRIGTPMFMALSVAIGAIRAHERRKQLRENLPKMKPATKEWYIRTSGQDRYDRYWGAMEKLDEVRTYDPKKHFFSHRAFHDAESFAWVIVNELMRAWPEGFEEELSTAASRHITILEEHSSSDGTDTRSILHSLMLEGWKNILHPRLAFLALMIYKLVMYFSVEWLLWPELPEDHGHEAIKVFLREAILDMKEKDDPIPLKQELCTPKRYESAKRKFRTPEATSLHKESSKRVSEQDGSVSKKSRAVDGGCAAPA